MTYSKRAQLSSSSLLPNRRDLRDFAGNSKDSSASLEVTESLHVHQISVEKRRQAHCDRRNKDRRHSRASAVFQYQHRDHDILHHNECRLAICAEREARAEIVRQADQVCRCLEEVTEEGDARRGFRVDELEDLRDFDDRAGTDDADSEALGDGELDALGRGWVDFKEKRVVALSAEDRDSEFTDRCGEVVCDGLQSSAYRIHSDDGVFRGGGGRAQICGIALRSSA